jgi:hypothetical protein
LKGKNRKELGCSSLGEYMLSIHMEKRKGREREREERKNGN